MENNWEWYMFLWIAIGLVVLVVLLEIYAWWQDKRRWRNVRPYYGKPYDASSKTYRPNVDLRRVR